MATSHPIALSTYIPDSGQRPSLVN